MDFLLLYYVFLVLWLPLLWPALRLRGWRRGLLLAVALAGALATVNEIWQTFGTVNAIRLDILLFAPVLGLLYAVAAAVLWSARWRIAAVSVAAPLLFAGGGMVYRWIEVTAETAQLGVTLAVRDELLFRAKFRDRATYEAYFGPFATTPGRFPAGHWQAPEPSWFRRLIVNGDGQAWLFYRCGATECAFGPSNQPLERVVGSIGFEWRGLLRPVIGEPLAVRIVPQEDQRVVVEARGQTIVFAKAPPPIVATAVPDTLTFLGSYAAATCIRKHAAVRQLWLWRQGERLFAVGVFRTLAAGRSALFVAPAVLGEGRRQGDGWIFEWKGEGERWAAAVTIGADGVSLDLTPPHGSAESVTLAPGAIFKDETITLAPRSTAEDWKRWFDTVWVGHSFSGAVPACP